MKDEHGMINTESSAHENSPQEMIRREYFNAEMLKHFEKLARILNYMDT
jgi:hypothetical protein